MGIGYARFIGLISKNHSSKRAFYEDSVVSLRD